MKRFGPQAVPYKKFRGVYFRPILHPSKNALKRAKREWNKRKRELVRQFKFQPLNGYSAVPSWSGCVQWQLAVLAQQLRKTMNVPSMIQLSGEIQFVDPLCCWLSVRTSCQILRSSQKKAAKRMPRTVDDLSNFWAEKCKERLDLKICLCASFTNEEFMNE